MRDFHPHKPLGERCYHAFLVEDSQPANTWITSIEAFRQEMDALEKNELDPALSFTEHRDYRAQLLSLMNKAQKGKIRFANPNPEGRVIERTGIVIELRPMLSAAAVFGRRPRLLRLYLAEPEAVPNGLLGLHLATKEDSKFGLDEQNQAIDEANQRAYEWEAS